MEYLAQVWTADTGDGHAGFVRVHSAEECILRAEEMYSGEVYGGGIAATEEALRLSCVPQDATCPACDEWLLGRGARLLHELKEREERRDAFLASPLAERWGVRWDATLADRLYGRQEDGSYPGLSYSRRGWKKVPGTDGRLTFKSGTAFPTTSPYLLIRLDGRLIALFWPDHGTHRRWLADLGFG
jgi:hypothetical protein